MKKKERGGREGTGKGTGMGGKVLGATGKGREKGMGRKLGGGSPPNVFS